MILNYNKTFAKPEIATNVHRYYYYFWDWSSVLSLCVPLLQVSLEKLLPKKEVEATIRGVVNIS